MRAYHSFESGAASTASSLPTYVPSITDARAAQARREFYPWIDLEASRKRVKDFVGQYPKMGAAISKAKAVFMRDGRVSSYRNPEDVADFCIGQFLGLNEKFLCSRGGEVFSIFTPSSLQDYTLNQAIVGNFAGLCAALEEIYVENNQTGSHDHRVTIALAQDQSRTSVMRALSLYQQAADGGHPYGQYMVGKYYENGMRDSYGRFLSRNQVKAVDYYKKAADQEYVPAQGDLGLCLFNGIGVERDTTRAIHLFARSANKGCDQSLNNLLLTQVQVDEAAENTPLTAEQIIEVIAALSQNPQIASQKIAQDESTLIIDLVDASQSVLGLDDLREISRALGSVSGINPSHNNSLIGISKIISTRQGCLESVTSQAATKLLLGSGGDDRELSENEMSEIRGEVVRPTPSSAVKGASASGVVASNKTASQLQLF